MLFMAPTPSKPPVRERAEISRAGSNISRWTLGVVFEERGLSLLSERRMVAKLIPLPAENPSSVGIITVGPG